MSTIEIGKKAPEFSGNDQNGVKRTLKEFAGKKLVLYFYPKDDTPGCTAEACDLRDNYKKFIAAGYAIVGVSPDEEKKHQTEVAEQFKPLVERLQESLKDRVKEVRVTLRLVDSPSCVVVGQNDLSPHLQRMLKAAGQAAPDVLPVLEINPEHALVARIQTASDETFNDWATLLFEQALLADGSQLPDPTAFVKRVNQLLLA